MPCPASSSAVCPQWVTNNKVDWCAPAGIKQLKELLCPQLPYEPAEHQLISTARILMGQHIMCVWATGEGKSSVFYMHALARRGTLTFVVAPTNALEADMVQRLQRMGITAVAVNRDTVNAAAKQRPARDLWAEVRKGSYRVVLLSPEMLQTDAFKGAITDSGVRMRLAIFCVDECHLIDEWGRDFRTAYGAIKDTIPWLPTWTVRVGLTATLEPGRQTSAVMEALGFTDSNSHLDRRDCERRNIDIIFRPVQHSISTNEFLDLDELISPNLEKAADVPKTLIYCETIELGHRVAVYL
ncbi:P-loop containing nucleoside triphosphate hydrolase protein, partial [Irpex lacteus]